MFASGGLENVTLKRSRVAACHGDSLAVEAKHSPHTTAAEESVDTTSGVKGDIFVNDEKVAVLTPDVRLALKDGDRVHVRVRLSTPQGEVFSSAGAVFDSQQHVDGLPVEVKVAAFAPGNLKVDVRFRLAQDSNIPGIGGGIVWSNVIRSSAGQPLSGGGTFQLVNRSAWVRVADGLSIDALLHSSDENRVLLAPVSAYRGQLAAKADTPFTCPYCCSFAW